MRLSEMYNIYVYMYACRVQVVEGATIARFVKDWKGYLETPASMLLHSR